MDFVKILGPKSFIKNNFFYEMHEKLTFHKDLYQQTIDNIRLYKEDI
jgi:hypothetical protein